MTEDIKCEETDKIKDVKAVPLLPPCRVCNEKASGLHYGVNTCEACKAFFRRSMQRGFGASYRCVGTGECKIFENKRNSCSYCRFKKCLMLGMSKEAIKTGRYTHEKRAEDIMEVKRLAAIQDTTNNDAYISQPITSHIIKRSTPTKRPAGNIQNTLMMPDASPIMLPNYNQTSYIAELSNDNNNENFFSDKNVFINGFKVENEEEKSCASYDEAESQYEAKLIEIINTITKAFLKDTIFTEEFMQKLPERQKQYLEQRELQTAVFGPLKPLTKDEYHKIYKTTGIDVDGRKERIVEELPHMEAAIKRFICFAKSIPGFNQLDIEDQISLIKAAKFEAWMVTCHRLFNSENQLYTEQSGHIVSMEQMKMVNNGHFVDEIFNLTSKLQKLQLTTEETTVLAAICLMSTDICELQNRDVVTCSQDLLLRCLLYSFHKHDFNNRLKFAHVINCMIQMRSLKELHAKEEEIFVLEWSNAIEIPKLVYEIWSS